jgi:hypothetical protein
MNNNNNNNNTEPTGTAILAGILITTLLTQTAIWTPLYILHKYAKFI